MPNNDYYQKSPEEVVSLLSSSEKEGLTTKEAGARLRKYGSNEIEAKIELPYWLLFLAQFKELLVIILIIGSLISFIIGNIRDGTIILIIVLVNAIIGFVHEYKANKIVEKLKTLVRSQVKVVRNGKLTEITQQGLVPGDIIRLEEGDKVPADTRILQSNDIKTNEFTLTGESLPQEKNSEPILGERGIADRSNMVYAGTTVASGNAVGIVIATGMGTETGKIASLTEETSDVKTPLQQELRLLARQLTFIVIIISIGLFFLGLLQHFSIYMSLVYALGVAMAVVPQALPAEVTVALSNGSNYLANRKAVVKSLPAVETLGSTTVICTDKTGTLTENEMTLRALWHSGGHYKFSGTGYCPEGDVFHIDDNPVQKGERTEIIKMLMAAAMASTAEIHPPDREHNNWYCIGDPTEAALIAAASKVGIDLDDINASCPELHQFSFTSERKRMSSIRKKDTGSHLYVKGSVDSIISISNRIEMNGKEVPLTKEHIAEINDANEYYAEDSMRVLALGYKRLNGDEKEYVAENVENEVVFLGLVAMMDPPKQGVKKAIQDAKKAHIRIFILTGDYALTAEAIGREIGLSDGNTMPIINGTALKKMNDEDLANYMVGKESIIFSRADPEDKLRIVTILEEQGEIVAVTGDGVNDAPALKRAHIGVAMGLKGTEVAKEASNLILLDDNFATLVDAVKGGRTIYNNLKKTISASMTTNSGELTVVLLGLLGAAIWNYPIPILAAQILAIDLLAQVLPLTFLTFDPPDPDIMVRPPRKPSEHIFNRWSGTEVVVLGIVIGILAFMNFLLFMNREGVTLTIDALDSIFYLKATALSYGTIVFCQFINTMERRYTFTSLFNKNFYSNKLLLWALVISIGLVLLAIYGPGISDFLSFGSIGLTDWIYILLSAGIYLIGYEILKVAKKYRHR